MKKEKSIFVTEGYLLREVMTFLTEGVGEISSKRKKNKKNVYVELHSSRKSIGRSLNVLPLY